jgi:O-antigen/teichoic acid export membrane protein
MKYFFALTAKAVIILMSYGFTILFTRLFSVELLGKFIFAWSIATGVRLISLIGIDGYTVRESAVFFQDKKNNSLYSLYTLSILIVLALSFLISSIAKLLLADIIILTTMHDQDLIQFLETLIIIVPFYSIIAINSSFLIGLKLPKLSIFLKDGLLPFCGIISILASYLTDSTAHNFITYFTNTIIITAIISYIALSIIIRPTAPESTYSISTVKKMLFESLLFLYSNFASYVSNHLEIIILGTLLSFEFLGVFVVLKKICKVVNIPLVAINSIQAPIFATFFANKNNQKLKKYAKDSTSLITLIAFPLVIIIILMPNQILSLFDIGSDPIYELSLRVLALGSAFNVFSGSSNLLLKMTGHQKALVPITTISIGIHFSLLYILIPYWHLTGAAIASTTGIVLLNSLSLKYAQSNLGYNTLFNIADTYHLIVKTLR